ncbi:unnamed protein product [Schistosoma turkestanicum]|nr:unnamed protein product [Schistosoma turkestanicum]
MMILSSEWDLVPYSNLLEVQKEVFEYFTDLRNVTKSFSPHPDREFDISMPDVDLVCTCYLKPEYGIVLSDVKLFKELLLKISSAGGNKSSQPKKRELHKLQKLHSLILQAQISVQKQLESASPCSHNGLTFTNEKHLMELLAKEQTSYINTLPSSYKLKDTTKSVTEFSTITFNFIEFPQRNPFVFKIPPIEKFFMNKQIDMAYCFEKMLPFPTSVHKQIHHSTEYVVLLTENVLSFLFLLKALVGVYAPFDVTVENSGASLDRKTIRFGNIILKNPLPPRVRTRLFYESLVKQQMCVEHKLSDQDLLKSGSTINTDVEKMDISSSRTLRSYTKAQEYDLSTSKLDLTEELNDTDDELIIDLDGPESNDHNSKQLDSSISTPGNIANFCTVVEKSTVKQPCNINSPSLIDFSSAPASPTDEIPKSPCRNKTKESKSIIHSPSPRIIPLEPVQITCELPQDSSSLERVSSPKRLKSNSSKSNKMNKTEVNKESNVNSIKAYSYSSLRLGNKCLLVQFYDTIWLNNESCQACNTIPSCELCPLWPSCNTRNRTCNNVDDESMKNHLKPICIQIKPEYLGDWGCEILENQELELSWLGSCIRNNSDILRIRLHANSGKIILAEYQSMEEMLKTYLQFKPQDNINRLSGLLDQLFNLQPGSYLLTQTKCSTDDSFDIYQSINDNPSSYDVDACETNLNQITSQFSTSSERLLNLLSLKGDEFTGATIPEEIASSLYLVRRLKLDLDIPAGFEKIHISENDKSERSLKLPGLDCMKDCHKGNSNELLTSKLTSDTTNKTSVTKAIISKKKKPAAKKNTNTTTANNNHNKGKQPPTTTTTTTTPTTTGGGKNTNSKHRRKRQRSN